MKRLNIGLFALLFGFSLSNAANSAAVIAQCTVLGSDSFEVFVAPSLSEAEACFYANGASCRIEERISGPAGYIRGADGLQGGGEGVAWGGSSASATEQRAIQLCQDAGGRNCTITLRYNDDGTKTLQTFGMTTC